MFNYRPLTWVVFCFVRPPVLLMSHCRGACLVLFCVVVWWRGVNVFTSKTNSWESTGVFLPSLSLFFFFHCKEGGFCTFEAWSHTQSGATFGKRRRRGIQGWILTWIRSACVFAYLCFSASLLLTHHPHSGSHHVQPYQLTLINPSAETSHCCSLCLILLARVLSWYLKYLHVFFLSHPFRSLFIISALLGFLLVLN